jgi:D-alanyl-D-alanine-carboxypeptidase/D-alanyl-D-alanine-endopeptidase
MPKRSRQFLIAFMLMWVAAIPPLCHGFDDKAKIDPFAQRWIHDHLVVGLVIGIVKRWAESNYRYGETLKDSGIRPDGNTFYEIGSISKVFTGVLLGSLVEEQAVN